MSSEAILTVSALVVAITQYVKWAGFISDKRGPIAVLLISLFGVSIWVISFADTWSRGMAFGLLVAWINVTLAAAGIYGFTRSMPEAITTTSGPPAGAGASPTAK